MKPAAFLENYAFCGFLSALLVVKAGGHIQSARQAGNIRKDIWYGLRGICYFPKEILFVLTSARSARHRQESRKTKQFLSKAVTLCSFRALRQFLRFKVFPIYNHPEISYQEKFVERNSSVPFSFRPFDNHIQAHAARASRNLNIDFFAGRHNRRPTFHPERFHNRHTSKSATYNPPEEPPENRGVWENAHPDHPYQ